MKKLIASLIVALILFAALHSQTTLDSNQVRLKSGNSTTFATAGPISGTTNVCGDGSGNVTTSGCGAGGTQFQVNTVDLLNCSGTVCPLQNMLNSLSSFGYQVTATNPSGGQIQMALATPYTQISTPSAPTLTTNGSAGSTSYTYKVVACEDGPACAYHTPASSATAIATGNATLTSSNSINLKVYGDTLAWVRCFNIYRTASSGTPSSTGKIATCADKQFIDTGLAGDSTTAPSDNTTKLDPDGALVPLPGCASNITAPKGIDSPPCSPNAMDDEFTSTYGALGDANNPMWAWVNQNSATTTLSSGMVQIQAPNRGSTNLNCLVQPVPGSTPYTFEAIFYLESSTTNANNKILLAFYEQSSGKFSGIGYQTNAGSNTRLIAEHYTSTTAESQVFAGNFQAVNPGYYTIQNDGTNIVYKYSPDGVFFQQILSEAKTVPFTTAPTFVGLCVDNSSGQGSMDADWFRRIQ